jgi:hypothetical protein
MIVFAADLKQKVNSTEPSPSVSLAKPTNYFTLIAVFIVIIS